MKDLTRVLVRPVVTEKSTDLKEFKNAYVFEVALDANKHEIRRAVEELFKVQVVTVRTMRQPRKTRRMGRFTGRRPEWKKALVQLAEGQSIEFFEGV